MHLVCPQCHAVYEVPRAALVSHPRVRCARCGAEWTPEVPEEEDLPHATPASPVPAADAAFEPDQAAAPAQAASDKTGPSRDAGPGEGLAPLGRTSAPPRPAASRAIWIAWAVSLLVVLAGIAGFFGEEAVVVHAFPPALRLYHLFGRTDPPPPEPLAPTPAPPPIRPAG